MHTRTINTDDATGVTFLYNSDLSGDVEIRVNDGRPFKVPGDALLQFVAGYVNGRKIATLEQQEWYVTLGIDPRNR